MSTNTSMPATSMPAQAQAQKPNALFSFAPIALIMLFMYFLMLRPQKKQEAERRNMRDALKKGDMVILRSGVVCKFEKKLNANEAYVEVAEGVRIKVLLQAIDGLYSGSLPGAAPSSNAPAKTAPRGAGNASKRIKKGPKRESLSITKENAHNSESISTDVAQESHQDSE